MEYYNSNIQLCKGVCEDIVETVKEKSKHVDKKISMLVWGLGYDSILWYNIPNIDVAQTAKLSRWHPCPRHGWDNFVA